MDYDSLMTQLTEGMRNVHGDLKEVIFLDKSKYISLLCFTDKTVLPTYYYEKGDRYWQVVAYSVNNYDYIDQVAAQIKDQDPLSLLTFGYGGTGSRCYSAFLKYFGFAKHDVENIQVPSKLKKDGTYLSIEKEEIPIVRIKKKIGMAFWKQEYWPD